ncbi:helix-turn-helix transcriptional regulator [Streptacidiphilus melanogenes]|uniref:helix-turn-helix transcriptional regulator n=1 Tax=Streptacidiphilus melanogenes TaxID=411235 RepID=UPI0005A8AFEB|nr:LuxR family transcriptional regulator [Streptacidiphilus melanogenes]
MRSQTARVIGRDTQLGHLRQALEDARQGRGGAVFIVGEAGVGKSRLAAEAAGEAFTAGMRVLRGRSTATGPTVPFRPLTEALMSLFRGGEPIDDQALGPYRPVLGRLIPEWSVGDHENSSMVILGEAVLRLLIAAGRGRGQLLLLEDLHEADPETLAVVEYLVDNLEYTPVTLLATIRTEFSDALDLASAARRRGTGTVLDLPPLTRPQVQELIAVGLGVEPAQVPPPVLERLWDDSSGSPFLVEELLQSLVGGGALVQGLDGWRVVGDLRSDVSGSLARGILRRIDRLGPQGLALLSAAAVLGRRFPLTVLQRMTGVDDRSLLSHLHAGVAAQLVLPDEPAPDWYAFRHSLTLEALFTQLTPDNRAKLAHRAADALEELHPRLTGEWCPLAAELRLQAGEEAEAGRLYAEAGRRALADGAIGSAVALLDRAERLLGGLDDAVARAEVLESLLPALAEAGEFGRAFDLAEHLRELGGADLSRARIAALHTRLAKVAHTAGRWVDGNRQVALAREALGPRAEEAYVAPVDVVAAYLALDTPGPDRTQLAEKLARSAVEVAERHELSIVACQGWELLAVVARERDPEEARAVLERALGAAERHRLPLQRLYALTRIGGNGWLAETDPTGLRTAREEALRLGAATIVYTIDGILILDSVLRGEFGHAREAAEECLTVVRRLRLAPAIRYTLMAKASASAHLGDRAGMEEALSAFSAWDGAGSQEEVLAVGLARTFCALMEEDRELALRELAEVARLERDNPSTYYLSGRLGIGVLLDVLDGRADQTALSAAAATAPGRMRWNRQFLALADAVLLGREGRGEAASAAVAHAVREAEAYPVAQQLGLRLVAESAHADGWGEPVAWLRGAENFFHQREVPSVANACRAALRAMGASVHQHRSGADRIPEGLRAQGVTVREYEVFVVLAERLGNKDIAERLYISPRTVEKHIASLIAKTAVANRAALCALSASTLQGRGEPREKPPGADGPAR